MKVRIIVKNQILQNSRKLEVGVCSWGLLFRSRKHRSLSHKKSYRKKKGRDNAFYDFFLNNFSIAFIAVFNSSVFSFFDLCNSSTVFLENWRTYILQQWFQLFQFLFSFFQQSTFHMKSLVKTGCHVRLCTWFFWLFLLWSQSPANPKMARFLNYTTINNDGRRRVQMWVLMYYTRKRQCWIVSLFAEEVAADMNVSFSRTCTRRSWIVTFLFP